MRRRTISLVIILSLLFIMAVLIQHMVGYRYLAKKYGQEFRIDPLLIEAIVQVESNSRPWAISSSGAIGLMQIMPETGKEVARELNIPFSRLLLYNPRVNIRIGSYYLAKMIQSFGGNIDLALAAYNAGPGNVRRWMEANPGKDGTYIIEKKAFPQTREYVQRVKKAYRELVPLSGSIFFGIEYG